MPVLKLYHHGLTAGVPPAVNSHARAKRGTVGGWSNASTRSNTRFLYAVEEQHLTGQGFALSLTLGDCPPSHEDWRQLRERFFQRLRDMGLVRAHWLTEWQRRGCPHLHAAVWLPRVGDVWQVVRLGDRIIAAWLAVSSVYRAGKGGQHVEPINDSIGWFKYLSKHAVRGIRHYQRSPESIPKGWRRTGRMWGYLGKWPLRESMRLEMSSQAFHVFRRLVRAWRKADARASGDRRRIRAARTMLSCSDARLSAVRGVSEWLELDTQLGLIANVAALGHEVQQV